MSLTEKLKENFKKVSRAAVLSGAIATGLSGCMTNWQIVRTDWQATGQTQDYVDSEKKLLETTREFSAPEPLFVDNSGDIKFRIKELATERDYLVRKVNTVGQFQGINVEERKNYSGPIAVTIGGAILGGLLGSLVPNQKKEGETYGGIGFLIGGATGLAIVKDAPGSTERRSVETGTIDSRVVNSRDVRNLISENIKYNGNGMNILTELSAEEKSSDMRTNYSGEINLSDFVESLNPRYFFRGANITGSKNYSRKKLEERIKKISIIREIKPQTLEALMNDLINGLTTREIRVEVKTKENPNENEKIINLDGYFNLKSDELTEDMIYNAVRKFVDKEINSKVKALAFDVKDITTHVPVRNSNFTMSVEAPSKDELLGKYFTGGLRSYSQKFVSDYLRGENSVDVEGSNAIFYVYAPARVSVEVTNPDYKYVIGNVSVDRNTKKIVYMVDKGSKVRLEKETESGGKIE